MNTESQTEKLKRATGDTIDKLQESGQDLQERMGDMFETGRDKIAACMRTTDRLIHEKPYQSLAIALGLGLLFSLFLIRRRY